MSQKMMAPTVAQEKQPSLSSSSHSPSTAATASLEVWLRVCREHYVSVESSREQEGVVTATVSGSSSGSGVLNFVSNALSSTKRLQMRCLSSATTVSDAETIRGIHEALKATLEVTVLPPADTTSQELEQWRRGLNPLTAVRGVRLWLQCHTTYAEARTAWEELQPRIAPMFQTSTSDGVPLISSPQLCVEGLEQLFPAGNMSNAMARRAAARTRVTAVTTVAAAPSGVQGTSDVSKEGQHHSTIVIPPTNQSLLSRVYRQVHDLVARQGPWTRVVLWTMLTMLLVRVALWVWGKRSGGGAVIAATKRPSRSASFSL